MDDPLPSLLCRNAGTKVQELEPVLRQMFQIQKQVLRPHLSFSLVFTSNLEMRL
jgi:hypothetical protein